MWDALIAYSNLTEDTQFNDVIVAAIRAQAGNVSDYEPNNYGPFLDFNDMQSNMNCYQSQWALTALSAAGLLPSEQTSDLRDLAIAVWDAQVARWNYTMCKGGLRDPIFSTESDTRSWQ